MSIPVPKTAMVLAAGLGSRMRPLTDTTPKPLLEIVGKRLIDRMLDPLVAAGVERVIVNVHWLAEQVEAHVQARADLEVIISDERGARLETGGALAKVRELLGDDPVYVVNTDAFWAPESAGPVQALADAFDPSRMDACLLVADRMRALGFAGAGDFTLQADGQLAFRGAAAAAPMAYCGLRIIKPQLYDARPVEAFSAVDVWKALAAKGRLFGHKLDAFWLHVGDPVALKDADMWLRCHGA